MAKEITRVTVNLNSDLVRQVDSYADSMNINRTAAVAVLLSQSLNGQKAMTDLGEFVKLYQDELEKANNKSE